MNNVMNWPIKWGWECVICGNQPVGIDGIGLLSVGLHWGIVHATCYCNDCNTPYRMRDEAGEVVITPICQVKKEWLSVTKALWKTHGSEYLDLEEQSWIDEFKRQNLPVPVMEENDE